jgi:hypothetical protein
MGLCQKMSAWLFENAELQNRIWECDKLSKRGLLILRSVMGILLLEINILGFIVYTRQNAVKLLSVTSLCFMLALIAYALMFIQYLVDKHGPSSTLWKVSHCFFEVAFSVTVGFTIVFWCVFLPMYISKSTARVADMHDSTLDIAINIQLHLVVFCLYLVEIYCNRIEFPLRHTFVVLGAGLVAMMVFLLVGKVYRPIEDYVNWSDSEYLGFSLAAAVLVIGAFFFAALTSDKKKARYALKPSPKPPTNANDNKDVGSADRLSFGSI